MGGENVGTMAPRAEHCRSARMQTGLWIWLQGKDSPVWGCVGVWVGMGGGLVTCY